MGWSDWFSMLLPLFALILGSTVMYISLQRRAALRPHPSTQSGTDAVVEGRYASISSQFHYAFEIVAIAMIGYRPSHLHAKSPSFVLGVLCAVVVTTAALHLITRRLNASQRNEVYRTAYLSNDAVFRAMRLTALFRAQDQVKFVRSTAGLLVDKYGMGTLWSAFAGGLFIGIIQPSSTLKWQQMCFVCAAIVLPLVPPLVALIVTTETVWASAVLTCVTFPLLLGYLVEYVQRSLITNLLGMMFRNEAAISLPTSTGPDSVVHSQHSSSGRSLLDYEQIGILGFGSTSQVRLMREKASSGNGAGGELRAIKSVFKVRGGKPIGARSAARVAEERSILLSAHDHPFVVRMFNAFEDEHCFHLVLEYASSGTLSQWLTGALSEHIARLAGAETLSALGHLHSVGIVYRDLKPDNVLVRSDGHTVIADFGISKRLREGADAETQEANSMVGTPGFIAPEVLRSHFAPPDQRPGYKFEPDFWAYGVLLHLMLSGDEPTTSGSVVAALHMPTEQQAQSTTSTLSPTLAGDARDLIAALLVYEPTERLGSKGGAPVVQAHPFFSPIDWQRLTNLELPPPFPTRTS
mgnify:CR=1 FL=1